MSKNRLFGHIAYLAGSIDNSRDFKSWREDITTFLQSINIGVLNPCDKSVIRNSKINEDENFLSYIESLKTEKKYKEIQEIMQEIVRVDLKMVDLSNFLILNIERDVHMCGSYAEQTLACFQRKPILVHCSSGINKIPNWLFGVCDPELFFDNWQALKDYIESVNNGVIIDDMDSKWRFINYHRVFRR